MLFNRGLGWAARMNCRFRNNWIVVAGGMIGPGGRKAGWQDVCASRCAPV